MKVMNGSDGSFAYALIAIVLFSVAVLVFSDKSSFTTSNNPSTIKLSNFSGVLVTEKDFYDFGRVSMAEGLVSYDYKLKNLSQEVVPLKEISTSCMCTSALLITGRGPFGPFGMPGHMGKTSVEEGILPGEDFIVRVTFDPAAHGPAGVGKIDRSISLSDGKKNLELKFSAFVTP